MEDELRRQFEIPIRWTMGDLLINKSVHHGCVAINKFNIKYFGPFEVDETNMSAIAIGCITIEMLGRILLGFGDSNATVIPEQSFRAFTHYYLGKIDTKYANRSKTLLNNYRNNFLHSYILSFKSKRGFFPTRNERELGNKHLEFMPHSRRLILNIDRFVDDIKRALELYFQDIENNVIIYPRLNILINPPNRFLTINKINLKINAKNALKKFRYVA